MPLSSHNLPHLSFNKRTPASSLLKIATLARLVRITILSKSYLLKLSIGTMQSVLSNTVAAGADYRPDLSSICKSGGVSRRRRGKGDVHVCKKILIFFLDVELTTLLVRLEHVKEAYYHPLFGTPVNFESDLRETTHLAPSCLTGD